MAVAVAIVAVAWRRKAPVVFGLVIANFAVFFLMVLTSASGLVGVAGSPLLDDLALRVADLHVSTWWRSYTIITAAFLHADLPHVLGNMVVLVLMGLPFEDRVGRARFLAIYVLGSVVAVLLHAVWIHLTGTPRDLQVPVVGASGAVFAVMGAFATLYPKDRVFVPVLFIIRMPVVIAAMIYTLIEGVAILGGATSRVAHAAHLGGVVGGILFALLLRPVRPIDQPAGPMRVKYDVLDQVVSDATQRGWVVKLRENEDHPDTQRAWLERLLPTLRSPHCKEPMTEKRRGRLVCPHGEEVRYAE